MSDTSQGPGWWQASDLKWYPPEAVPAVAPAPTPPAAAAPAPWAVGTPAPWGASVPHAPTVVAARPKRRRGGALTMLLVLVVVVGGVVAGAVLAVRHLNPKPVREEGVIVRPGTLPVGDLEIGDCFDEPSGSSMSDIEVAPCDQPHTAEVIYLAYFSDGRRVPYPGEQSLSGGLEEPCREQFASYIGVPLEQSTLVVGTFFPLEALWNSGTRISFCYVTDNAGQQMTSSVKGAAR